MPVYQYMSLTHEWLYFMLIFLFHLDCSLIIVISNTNIVVMSGPEDISESLVLDKKLPEMKTQKHILCLKSSTGSADQE